MDPRLRWRETRDGLSFGFELRAEPVEAAVSLLGALLLFAFVFGLFAAFILFGLGWSLGLFVFVLPQFWMGAFLAYEGLRKLFGSSTIQLSRTLVACSTGPLPPCGGFRAPTEHIDRFMERRQTALPSNMGFSVVALNDEGCALPLLALLSQKQAHYVVERLNQALELLRQPLAYRG